MYIAIAIFIFLAFLVVTPFKKSWLPNLLGYPLDQINIRKSGRVENELFAFAWIRLSISGSSDSDDVWTFIFSYIVFILMVTVLSALWGLLLPIGLINFIISKVLLKKEIKNKNNN